MEAFPLIASIGLQIHILCSALRSVGSLEYHTYCNTGIHLQGNLGARGTVSFTPLGGSVTSCFNELGMPRPGFEHPTYCMRDERGYQLHHRCD